MVVAEAVRVVRVKQDRVALQVAVVEADGGEGVRVAVRVGVGGEGVPLAEDVWVGMTVPEAEREAVERVGV